MAVAKKICLVGEFGVGKTSLISQYVHQTFSEKYFTTIGVKIDSKAVLVGQIYVRLVIWDLAGKSAFTHVDHAYLRGASGYMMVCDGTRKETLTSALTLQDQIKMLFGENPFVMLVNKADLMDDWEIDKQQLSQIRDPILNTSARTGSSVEEAFMLMANRLMDHERT